MIQVNLIGKISDRRDYFKKLRYFPPEKISIIRACSSITLDDKLEDVYRLSKFVKRCAIGFDPEYQGAIILSEGGENVYIDGGKNFFPRISLEDMEVINQIKSQEFVENKRVNYEINDPVYRRVIVEFK